MRRWRIFGGRMDDAVSGDEGLGWDGWIERELASLGNV